MQTKVDVSPPWYTLLHKFEALFGDDPELTVGFESNDDGYFITLESRNSTKLDALEKMLKPALDFGNVGVKLKFKVSNDAPSTYERAIDAFSGNPMFEDILPRSFMPGAQIDQVCVIMKKDIVQFFNDNLDDFYGNLNLLPTDIAKEIFADEDGTLQFSISIKDSCGD